jgi:hypothetical protein
MVYKHKHKHKQRHNLKHKANNNSNNFHKKVGRIQPKFSNETNEQKVSRYKLEIREIENLIQSQLKRIEVRKQKIKKLGGNKMKERSENNKTKKCVACGDEFFNDLYAPYCCRQCYNESEIQKEKQNTGLNNEKPKLKSNSSKIAKKVGWGIIKGIMKTGDAITGVGVSAIRVAENDTRKTKQKEEIEKILKNNPDAKIIINNTNFEKELQPEKPSYDEKQTEIRRKDWEGFGFRSTYVGNGQKRWICPNCGAPALLMCCGLAHKIGTGGGVFECENCNYKKTYNQLIAEGGAHYNY